MLALALSALLTAAPAPESLVVGMATDDGALSTWFASPSGLKKLGDGLALLRKEGPWVAVSEGSKTQVQCRALFAWPAGKPAERQPLGNGCGFEGCDSGHYAETLLFAEGDSFSLATEGSVKCGGEKPVTSHTFETLRFGETGIERVAIDEALGADATEVFTTAAGTITDDACSGAPPAKSWGVVRRGGAWRVLGEPAFSDRCPHPPRFDTGLDLPKTLGGGERPVDLKSLSAKHPFATDAAMTPNGKLLFVVTDKGLELYLDGEKVGAAELAGARVVSLHAVAGAKPAQKLAEQLAKALAKP